MTLSPDEFFGGVTIEDLQKYRDWFKKISDELEELDLKLKMVTAPGTTGWGGEEPLGLKPGEMSIGGKTIKIEDYLKDLENTKKTFESIGADINNIWSSNISQMIADGQKFGDAMKEIFLDMGNYAISQIIKIAMNMAIFGNTSGTYSFIPIKAFGAGGYADQPTLGIIAERGEREWIIPESKMPGGQTIINNTVVNNIRANDVDSFRRLMDENRDLTEVHALRAYAKDRKVFGGATR
jgi:hypothetical protein